MPPVAPLRLDRIRYAGGRLLTDPEGLVDDLNRIIGAMYAESVGDDQPPHLERVDVSSVRVIPSPSSPAEIRLTLQDFKQRTFDSPLILSLPGSLDVGSEASDTWYYAYAIPSPLDSEGSLIGVLSANPPNVGPTGNTSLFRYLGAVRNDGSSDLLKFSQAGAFFKYHSIQPVQSLGAGGIATEGSPVAVALSSIIPETAEDALLVCRLSAQAGGTGMVKLFVDGSETDPQFDFVRAKNGGNMERSILILVPTVPKQVFRQLQETSGQLDTYDLDCVGWFDSYLG